MGAASAVTAQAANDELINTLIQKGFLTQSEADAIQDDSYVVKPKGKTVTKLTISGRIQAQYDWLNAEQEEDGVADVSYASTNHFYLRRLFLGAKAELGNGWYGDIVMDFAGEDAAIDKAVLGWDYAPAAEFSIGYFKVPFGLEETSSSSKIKTLERSAANRFFADDIDFSSRHTGIKVEGTPGDMGLYYAFMVANQTQGESSRLGGTAEASNNLGAWGRLQYKTKIQDASVLFGSDLGFQPENTVVTNGGNESEILAYTIYASAKLDALYGQVEFFGAEIEGDTASGYDSSPIGFAAQVAYKFDKLEPVYRYSYVDADGSSTGIDTDELIRRAPSGVTAGSSEAEKLHSHYIGLNYYIQGDDVKFMAGYEWAYTDEFGPTNITGTVHGLRARLQILF